MSSRQNNDPLALRSRARCLTDALAPRLARNFPEAWRAFEIAAARAVEPPVSEGYGRVARSVSGLLNVVGQPKPECRAPFARYWLASLIATPPENISIALPAIVETLQKAEFQRILTELEDEYAQVDIETDRWKKNLAILLHQLIPVGAEFAALGSGIPRRMLLRGSIQQRLRFLRTVASETYGFRPFFELHAHPDSLEAFHPDGWVDTYHCLAEALLLNPKYKGVMASSWFRDPALRIISPRLAYLREYPEQHGAHMFLIGDDTDGTSGALARSPTRQRLYKEGRYVPRIYMMVWPRSALLNWHFGETRHG